MLSLSDKNRNIIFEAFKSTSRYLDSLLHIDNSYFAQMVSQIYQSELQVNKAKLYDTDAPFTTWTCPQPMAQFHPNIMINQTILIVIFLALLHMVIIFRS